MSVVLICFPGAPKVSPEAVKREAELDKYLEGRVEGRGEELHLGFVDHHRKWDIDIIIPFPFIIVHLWPESICSGQEEQHLKISKH